MLVKGSLGRTVRTLVTGVTIVGLSATSKEFFGGGRKVDRFMMGSAAASELILLA
jgi:hypothetical protein